MKNILLEMVNRLDGLVTRDTDIIKWASPILSFGDVSNAIIATVGLNPSNKEFVSNDGHELDGNFRRFQTLKSLGLKNWNEVREVHIELMLDTCKYYFRRNPYDMWFKTLDHIISGTSLSYYFPSERACHLDLIPYATSCKWVDIPSKQQSSLLESSTDLLGMLLRESSIEILVLNGKSVVDNFERMGQTEFQKKEIAEWLLPRKSTRGVSGLAYTGTIDNIGGIEFGRSIHILGFNHNLQSSYGVTTYVKDGIRSWITEIADQILLCDLVTFN